jgi:hypothetical protein
MSHLSRYAFACEAMEGEGEELGSMARAIFRRLGRLPRTHHVPESVGSLEEFLVVLSHNQDSPQKDLHLGMGISYNRRDRKRGDEPHIALNLSVSALINCGVEKVGHKLKRSGDIEGARCEFRDENAAIVAADKEGYAVTPEQKQSLARATIRLYLTLRDFVTKARRYGFDWIEDDADHLIDWIARQCMESGVPFPDGDEFAGERMEFLAKWGTQGAAPHSDTGAAEDTPGAVPKKKRKSAPK